MKMKGIDSRCSEQHVRAYAGCCVSIWLIEKLTLRILLKVSLAEIASRFI